MTIWVSRILTSSDNKRTKFGLIFSIHQKSSHKLICNIGCSSLLVFWVLSSCMYDKKCNMYSVQFDLCTVHNLFFDYHDCISLSNC